MSVVRRLETGIGEIMAEVPRMASILKRFDPIMLPRAMSTLRLRKASTDVVNSGSEVPIATMTLPTKV